MRKSFVYAAGLMCLALSITDCQKELVDQTTPASEPNFELFAQPVTTKTSNDGLDTRWVAKDAINVFHAEAGSTAYDSDGRFTVKDIETGRFDGTVSKSLSADKSYDWYAFYPYTSQITTPDNTASGYCYIGSRSDASQTQTGDNNMYHICGSNYPLYGIAKNVNASDVPSIQMQHLTSVIKIVVTNSTEEELSLNSVSFTAEENISGQFYIAFNSETPKYTSAGHPSKTANLTVSDIKVAPKAKATVYIAIKPFTAKTGTTLKLAVNGYEKTLTLKNDITFTAGHIKPLNFNYDKKAELVEYTAIDDVEKLSEGCLVCLVAKNNDKYYYLPTSPAIDRGKIVGVEVDVTDNKISTSMDNIAWVAKSSGKQWTLYDGKNYMFHAKGGSSGTDLALGDASTYTWNISNYSIVNKTFKFAAYSSNKVQNRGLLFKVQDNANIFGGYSFSNTTGYSAIMLFVRNSDIPADKPIISASDVTNVSARGVVNQELAYTITNTVEGAVLSVAGDNTVVEAIEMDGTITYDVKKNTSKESREGSITLTYSKGGETLAEKTVKVQQLAPVFKVSRASVELDATKGAQTTITVTSDFDWMANASTSAGFSFSPDTYTWQEGGKETVTITASNANASEAGTATLGTITFSNIETEEELIVTVTQKSSYVAPAIDTEATYGIDAFSGGTSGSGSALTIINSDSNISLSGVGYRDDTHVKIYANQTLTITPQNGKTITNIVITATTSTYVGTWKASSASVSVSGTSVTWTGTSTAAVTLTNTASKQARITNVVVTYK
ncbi:MAG: hypothetical protein SOU95_05740 [Candidatus Cryptobacteroides sp.]|nr:hypothetical protein [Bacteroidales bacterium]MDY2773999.1 hypothetical protein [Candidatus Cryptobacteroides sp.]